MRESRLPPTARTISTVKTLSPHV
eukprot:COSAG04_NODE_24078_length_327_cov_1.135965_1_plen_23_part_10